MSATNSDRSNQDGGRLDARELAAWRGLLRVHGALTKRLDAELIEAHGLPLRSYEVLLALEDAPAQGLRMSDVAESVLLSRSGITRLVDRLERDGLVQRRTCPSDQRGQNATITAAGRRSLTAARRTHLAGVRRAFLEHFDDEELATLGRLWERVLPGAAESAGEGC